MSLLQWHRCLEEPQVSTPGALKGACLPVVPIKHGCELDRCLSPPFEQVSRPSVGILDCSGGALWTGVVSVVPAVDERTLNT